MQETATVAAPEVGAQENEAVQAAQKNTLGKHVVVVGQRGWIMKGYLVENEGEELKLEKVHNVRSWNNGRGLGGITYEEYKNEYKLDKMGNIEFPPNGYIFTMDLEW